MQTVSRPDDDRHMRGMHAVVTGAGDGIGSAIAEELARLGADVTLAGRTGASLERRAEVIRDAHAGDPACVVMDAKDPASVSAAFGEARERHGPVRVLVNNVGGVVTAPFTRIPLQEWEDVLRLNLTSAFLCTQAALADMLPAGEGRIVSIASTAALRGYPYVAAYGAAKHAVLGMTRALALELARTRITVNAVCPGYVETPMLERSIARIAERTRRGAADVREELMRANPQGRFVHAVEVASLVGWLCSDAAASVTGQAIAVAGGEVM